MGNIWRRLYLAAFAGFAAWKVHKALATAWVWNGDQIVAALFGAALFAALATWGGILLFYGPEVAQARWAANRQGRKSLSLRIFLLSLLSWIGILGVLVAIFDFMQR